MKVKLLKNKGNGSLTLSHLNNNGMTLKQIRYDR